ncbi:hypothetical protein BDW22DRAFT_1421109 [Trametopsis cervina]|nr:hypothetical protein BDW22DRAFT_1421109 [Trametopsis cervina]
MSECGLARFQDTSRAPCSSEITESHLMLGVQASRKTRSPCLEDDQVRKDGWRCVHSRFVQADVVALLLFWEVLASLTPCAAKPTLSSDQLSFSVSVGGNDNHFIRDNVTSAQLLLTSPNASHAPSRLVVAFPAGNSGALTYFLPLNSSDISIELVNGSLSSVAKEFNNSGVQADLHVQGNVTLGVTIIGAVRAMRDYVEGNRTMHSIFNYTLESFNASSVRFHRRWINSTVGDPPLIFHGADLYLSVPEGSPTQFLDEPSENTTISPTVNIISPAGSSGLIRVAVVTNETSLVGPGPSRLFLAESTHNTQDLRTASQGLSNGNSSTADQVSFLFFADKAVAGGWRFLTYFGRDTLIALRLLMSTLTSDAIESVLGVVIERTNSTGAIAHEETIGDYASFINMNNGQPELGAPIHGINNSEVGGIAEVWERHAPALFPANRATEYSRSRIPSRSLSSSKDARSIDKLRPLQTYAGQVQEQRMTGCPRHPPGCSVLDFHLPPSPTFLWDNTEFESQSYGWD